MLWKRFCQLSSNFTRLPEFGFIFVPGDVFVFHRILSTGALPTECLSEKPGIVRKVISKLKRILFISSTTCVIGAIGKKYRIFWEFFPT